MKIGDKAPDFSLNDASGNKTRLSDFRGRNVVLYFYPKDDTPGCAKEACSLRDGFRRISEKAAILGVSMDSEDSHRKFASKYNLPFILLADTEGKVCRAYGVYVQKSGQRSIQRTTFIIDKNGTIKHVFEKVDVDAHADEVLGAL